MQYLKFAFLWSPLCTYDQSVSFCLNCVSWRLSNLMQLGIAAPSPCLVFPFDVVANIFIDPVHILGGPCHVSPVWYANPVVSEGFRCALALLFEIGFSSMPGW